LNWVEEQTEKDDASQGTFLLCKFPEHFD
jgi:hypothetical protein